jgi:hypothetical protein
MITALLLLNLATPAATFCTLANSLNRPLPLSFLTRDYAAMSRIHALTLQTLASKFPVLYTHLCQPAISFHMEPGRYLDIMFETIFTSALPLDEVTRLWDVWAFEGDAVLVRAAVAIFSSHETRLYGAENAREVVEILGAWNVDNGEKKKTAKEREDEWMQRVREAGRSGGSGNYTGSGAETPLTPQTPLTPRSSEA